VEVFTDPFAHFPVFGMAETTEPFTHTKAGMNFSTFERFLLKLALQPLRATHIQVGYFLK